MKEKSCNLLEALEYVKKLRSSIRPNPEFLKQLEIYQGMLKARWVRHLIGSILLSSPFPTYHCLFTATRVAPMFGDPIQSLTWRIFSLRSRKVKTVIIPFQVDINMPSKANCLGKTKRTQSSYFQLVIEDVLGLPKKAAKTRAIFSLAIRRIEIIRGDLAFHVITSSMTTQTLKTY